MNIIAKPHFFSRELGHLAGNFGRYQFAGGKPAPIKNLYQQGLMEPATGRCRIDGGYPEEGMEIIYQTVSLGSLVVVDPKFLPIAYARLFQIADINNNRFITDLETACQAIVFVSRISENGERVDAFAGDMAEADAEQSAIWSRAMPQAAIPRTLFIALTPDPFEVPMVIAAALGWVALNAQLADSGLPLFSAPQAERIKYTAQYFNDFQTGLNAFISGKYKT